MILSERLHNAIEAFVGMLPAWERDRARKILTELVEAIIAEGRL